LINFQPFQGEEHRSFNWSGGKPAALLVHGFPGTPAELRPLGQSLHRVGWTVQGLLLPGFGPEIETLPNRRAAEWVEVTAQALTDLQRKHDPVLLIGYSMGAALALQVAAAQPPSGLILLAPFQRLGSKWQQLAGFLLKPFLRHMRPFKKADFSDPQTRRGISNFFGGINLDDPEVQRSLRELTVPISLLEQLHQVGQSTSRLAGEVKTPTLVVQGTQDEVVDPTGTRKLLQRLAGPIHYAEVAGGHALLDPQQPTWAQVEHSIVEFANSLVITDESANPKRNEGHQNDR
jgi:carboxylesterase